jgi:hypothetical protein
MLEGNRLVVETLRCDVVALPSPERGKMKEAEHHEAALSGDAASLEDRLVGCCGTVEVASGFGDASEDVQRLDR